MPRPRIDPNGLAVLARAECLRLLASRTVGRVAVTSGGVPTILPVRYVLDDDAVVFRTGAGAKLYAIARGAALAFEVDDVDPATGAGWSVVVTGAAREVTDRSERSRLAAVAPAPSLPTPDVTHVVLLPTDEMSGRRLAPAVAHDRRPTLVREGPPW